MLLGRRDAQPSCTSHGSSVSMSTVGLCDAIRTVARPLEDEQIVGALL